MRNQRLYAVCLVREREGRRSYYRISAFAYRKESAVRNFQNSLLFASLNGVWVELRPVRLAFDESVPNTLGATLGQVAEACSTQSHPGVHSGSSHDGPLASDCKRCEEEIKNLE